MIPEVVSISMDKDGGIGEKVTFHNHYPTLNPGATGRGIEFDLLPSLLGTLSHSIFAMLASGCINKGKTPDQIYSQLQQILIYQQQPYRDSLVNIASTLELPGIDQAISKRRQTIFDSRYFQNLPPERKQQFAGLWNQHSFLAIENGAKIFATVALSNPHLPTPEVTLGQPFPPNVGDMVFQFLNHCDLNQLPPPFTFVNNEPQNWSPMRGLSIRRLIDGQNYTEFATHAVIEALTSLIPVPLLYEGATAQLADELPGFLSWLSSLPNLDQKSKNYLNSLPKDVVKLIRSISLNDAVFLGQLIINSYEDKTRASHLAEKLYTLIFLDILNRSGSSMEVEFIQDNNHDCLPYVDANVFYRDNHLIKPPPTLNPKRTLVLTSTLGRVDYVISPAIGRRDIVTIIQSAATNNPVCIGEIKSANIVTVRQMHTYLADIIRLAINAHLVNSPQTNCEVIALINLFCHKFYYQTVVANPDGSIGISNQNFDLSLIRAIFANFPYAIRDMVKSF